MVIYQDLICNENQRRSSSDANGIDYIEISAESLDDQRYIQVYFLKNTVPPGLVNNPNLVRIEGGVRIQGINVLTLDEKDNHLVVEVDRAGDFSTYTLIIDSMGLDPVFSRCDFSFKSGCPSRFDCKPRVVCPAQPRLEPAIDYNAKDYASFRQALLDLIPALVPDWKERHEADLGITLLELLAYAGDQLSYYQDAVANEAYLKTARQRISVRRHASLIDYRMHDGVSARTFIHFFVTSNGKIPKGTPVLTRIDHPLQGESSPPGAVIPFSMKKSALDAADVVFETSEELSARVNLNNIPIYTWESRRCCLFRGSTTADLARDVSNDLHEGDFLLFEEIKGPESGEENDAERDHRQVVRLTGVKRMEDPIRKLPLTRVTWDRKDALTFPLCISSKKDDGSFAEGISIARGNLVLADHGRTISGEMHPGPKEPGYQVQRLAHRIRLDEGPLSFCIDLSAVSTAEGLLATDPQLARPQILELKIAGHPDPWNVAIPNLINSGPFDQRFAVETDNDGRAIIRFGDGEYGMSPPDSKPGVFEAPIEVKYRIGIGRAGNLGPESLVHVVAPEDTGEWPEIYLSQENLHGPVRNPLPSWGGIDPEPIEKVKQLAPAAFHAEQLRAVTEEDYARAAEKHPDVSKAVATFRWTGSWHTVNITIDPFGGTEITPELKRRVKEWVERFTQAGYDLDIDGPIYVPLEIEADICVAPDHFKGDVKRELIESLSSRVLPDGRCGFFHPDNFTFGQHLYLSEIYAAIDAVEGVSSSEVTVFQPYGKSSNGEIIRGYISIGRLEVVRLDNDPSFPENGVLRLNMRGGK